MAKSSSNIFGDVHKRHSHWSDIKKADGEYRDFTKFDFAAVEKTGLGAVEIKPQAGPELPKGIAVAPLSSVVGPSFSLASLHLLQRGINLSSDKLLSWHGAHAQDGILIFVPAGVAAPPIHVQTFSSGSSALHHLIVLEKGAKAEIIIDALSKEKHKTDAVSLHTDVTEAVLEEDAQLTLTTVQDYSLSDWAFSQHYHHLAKFAKLTHTALAIGAAVSRTRAVNHLDGARSHADSYQIFLGRGQQFMDLESKSMHHVPDTGGRMTCKGAMEDEAVGVYRGMISIDRAAVNTVSHQSGAALLLSPDSKVNIIPCLQVANDQVEAGHGATVGSLDIREMFYLRSRGLDESAARLLALSGYFNELLAKIPGERSREHLRSLAAHYVSTLPIRHATAAAKPAPIAIPGNEARATIHQA